MSSHHLLRNSDRSACHIGKHIGNKSRSGMCKPAGSGRQRLLGSNLTSFTICVDMTERVKWQKVALERGISTGSLVREAMSELLGD